MKISQTPPYKPIIQMPHCCVPACISMILDRRQISHSPQEDIGNELGLVIASKNAHLFTNAKIDDSYAGKFGTQIDDKKYSVNKYFQNNNITLTETYYPAEKVENTKQFIEQNLSDGNDIIVCILNEVLYGKGSGHVSLVQEIDGNNITLIDPGIDKPKIREVKLDRLIEAMKANKRRGGFWLISSNNLEQI